MCVKVDSTSIMVYLQEWWRERVLSITIGASASSQQEATKSRTDNSKPHENQRPGHLKLFIDDRATLVI